MLFSNFLYGHAIEISIGLSSNANILSDFPGETLIRTAVTFLGLQNIFKDVMKVRPVPNVVLLPCRTQMK